MERRVRRRRVRVAGSGRSRRKDAVQAADLEQSRSDGEPDAARLTESLPAEAVSNRDKWLDWLASQRGTAALALAGALTSVAGFLTSASLGLVSIFSPIAFIILLRLTWRRKRKKLAACAMIALIVSLVLVVRVYFVPSTVLVFYNGDTMDNTNMPYVDMVGIPLTADPITGSVRASIDPLPSDVGTIEVSCWRHGVFNDGKRSGSLDWGKIVSGKFETLWIPMPFVRGLAPGKALTLLPCSDWRWQLQHPGY